MNPLIVGNWKMELSHKGEVEAIRSLKTLLKDMSLESDIVICPSFPSLAIIHDLLSNSKKIQLGAQAVHWEEKGPWTGGVSVMNIAPWASWVIVGHSEQRRMLNLSDDRVQQQAQIVLKHGLTPIVCIGETAEERDGDQTIDRLTAQMNSLLSKITRTSFHRLVIAYEPLWAIGSGHTPDPNDMAATLLLIRKLVAERFDRAVSERIRLIYGGSVSGDNVEQFMTEPGINGILVGNASTHPMQFVDIIKKVEAVYAG